MRRPSAVVTLVRAGIHTHLHDVAAPSRLPVALEATVGESDRGDACRDGGTTRVLDGERPCAGTAACRRAHHSTGGSGTATRRCRNAGGTFGERRLHTGRWSVEDDDLRITIRFRVGSRGGSPVRETSRNIPLVRVAADPLSHLAWLRGVGRGTRRRRRSAPGVVAARGAWDRVARTERRGSDATDPLLAVGGVCDRTRSELGPARCDQRLHLRRGDGLLRGDPAIAGVGRVPDARVRWCTAEEDGHEGQPEHFDGGTHLDLQLPSRCNGSDQSTLG